MNGSQGSRAARALLVTALIFVVCRPAGAQVSPEAPPPGATTIFPHPENSRWWLSGQLNLISQAHGDFRSPYEGENSLRSHREQALSSVWTLYTGVQVATHTEDRKSVV